MSLQQTLRQPITVSGIGLHSGAPVSMTLRLAEAGSGIRFKRMDVEGKKSIIPARYDLVTATRLGTTLTNKDGISISTIEHLMAALWGMGVDNALVEVSAPELPIMDGSSAPFIALIEKTGLETQAAPRHVIRVMKEVEVSEGAATARVLPFEGEEFGCTLDVTIDFAHPTIARSRGLYEFPGDSFAHALSAARTFCLAQEVEAMRAAGLARGGSLANAVVVGNDGVINEEGLRFADEFVRHKALDCVGDLYLAGARIEGAFTFERPGHGINNALLRALMADKSAWKLVPTEEAATRRAGALSHAYIER